MDAKTEELRAAHDVLAEFYACRLADALDRMPAERAVLGLFCESVIAAGLGTWAVLRELGRAGVAARVERHIGFARHLAQRARQHPRLELLLEPELSIVCFRYAASDAVNAEILLRLRRTTRSIPSSTVVAGHLAIRPCFINPRTRLADVDTLVDHVITIGDELTGLQSG
jgi:glutamate/tyrosine decarboxylase-like PLP-dependent enzyme